MSYSALIYKKDSKGKIRFLIISTAGDQLLQESGVLGTENPVRHAKVCTPKNVGKSNETTGAEQAEAQAKSLYTKKIREGYFDTQLEAETIDVIKPMLAKDYFKEKKKLVGKKIVTQPKLDGVRCIIDYNPETGDISAKTRENVPITTIDHIKRHILLLAAGSDQRLIFDGELYTHGNTFQENTKLVKNDYKDAKEPIDYYIYDMVDLTGKLPFQQRQADLVDLFMNYLRARIDDDLFLQCVISRAIPDDDTRDEVIKAAFSERIDQGYEGIMVRVLDSKYKINARSSDLLKYKEFIDTALPIVDVTADTARPTHGTVWVMFNGHKQKTGSKISHADREELLTNKDDYIGKTAEIRYFEETDEGKMRFAYYHGVRIDK